MLAAVVVAIGIASVLATVVTYNATRQLQQAAIETAYLSAVEARRAQLGDTTATGTTVLETDVGGVTGLTRMRYSYTWPVRPGVNQPGHYDYLTYVAPTEPTH